jgi:hypothetical protein
MAAHALVRAPQTPRGKAIVTGLASVIALLAPRVALACPYCAGRAGGGIATGIVLVTFVSLPFLFSWVVYRVIRAGTRQEEGM